MVGIKLATVTALFEDGTAKIQFFGEDVTSEKEYPYLASYVPATGDKVFLMPFAGSYVIIGKILYMETQGGGSVEYITAEDLTEELKKYAKTDHTHSGYAASNHSHSEYAASGHTHSEYASAAHTHFYLAASSGYYPSTNQVSLTTSGLMPMKSGAFTLGGSSYKWSTIYSTSSTISTSDENLKKNIQKMEEDERYEKMFFELLPIKYQFMVNESNRIHLGFGAQSVKRAMDESEIDSREFAGYIEMPVYGVNEDGTGSEEVDHIEYGLRYEEFIALNTMMIQKAFDRINELETKIKEMEGYHAETVRE